LSAVWRAAFRAGADTGTVAVTMPTVNERLPMFAYEDVEYLDLDGDGVPDAVRTTCTRSFDMSPDAVLIETIDRLAWGIDVDGLPEGIHVVDTLHTDLDNDGFAEHVESTEFEVLAS
jgi:hypothetical protein